MDTKPTSITADKIKGLVTILWKDGHSSAYPATLLRAACPCVTCRGGHENMRSTPDPEIHSYSLDDSPMTHVQTIEAIGSYAVTIGWEDGHHNGIYSWPYLRALCPCQACQEQLRHDG